jgi:signal transduction histidine kinase/ActR/RegA family two-component response regulator
MTTSTTVAGPAASGAPVLILRGIAVYVLLAATTSLAGWVFDVPRLTDWDNDGISIQPNATVAAITSAVALLLLASQRTHLAALCACVVMAIGSATIVEYVSGLDLGIDTLLMFERPWGRVGTVSPGRMGPPGSLSWTLIGIALLLTIAGGSRQRQTAAILGVVVLSISGLSVIGYLFGADPLYTIPTATVIAFQTATMILAMSLGVLVAVPERQPMRALFEHGAAGLLTRRLAPLVLLVPLALGMVRLAGQSAGLYDTAMGAAMFAIAVIAFLWAVLWWGATAVREYETKLAASTRDLARIAAEREDLLGAAQRARHEAETANRAKDEFLAVLSHELRSPLNAMLGWVHIMKRPGLDERLLRRGIDTLERNLRTQTQVINDLLDVTRIQSGKLGLADELVDFTAVVVGAIESARPVAEERAITLVSSIPDDEVMHVNGDQARLEQVVSNLLHNAIKFTPQAGRISVEIRRVERAVELAVADTGQGIAPELLPHVFDRFVQGQPATTRRHGGLGLGLSIVKELVQLHGGSVQAESGGVGLGARFTVSIPLALRHRTDERHERAGVRRSPVLVTNVDVLVVEDDDDSREALRIALEESGAQVRLASSVREALSAYAQRPPDVLISDIGMAEEDGYSLIQRIRAQEQAGGRYTLAVAMTGFASRFDHETALRAGFDEHIGKPIETEHLLQTLRALMASRSA